MVYQTFTQGFSYRLCACTMVSVANVGNAALCVHYSDTVSNCAVHLGLGKKKKNKRSALACAGFATIYISLVMQLFFACIKLLFAVMIGGACLSY